MRWINKIKVNIIMLLVVLMVLAPQTYLNTAYAQSIVSLYPQYTTSLASSQVIYSSAGSALRGFQVTTSSVAGYVMLFDATSAPADGAVTPVKCVYISYPGTVLLGPDPGTAWLAKYGWTVVFSSTGCFTKTASATAFISGQ